MDEIEPVTVPVVITPAVVEESIEETQEDVDLVAEMVAAEGIQNELRHEQILEGVAECQNRLEVLSASTMPTESPVLASVMAELQAIRAKVDAIQLEVQNLRQSESSISNRPASQSPTLTEETPVVLAQEESTDAPAPDVKQKKYRRL